MTNATDQRIERARRCLAEGRGVLAGDLAALLDRVDELERLAADTADLRRKANRNRAVTELADVVCPDIGHRAAARRLLAIAAQESRDYPPEVARLLHRIQLDGGFPTSNRAVGDIIKSGRNRNR